MNGRRDKDLREMVREALWNKDFAGWSSNHEGPTSVNSGVDPSTPVTDPVNPNFTPQSKTEFGVAVGQLVKNVPDEKVPSLYKAVKAAVDSENEKSDEEMMKTSDDKRTSNVEETIRRQVRKILEKRINEARPPKTFGPVVGPLPPVKKIPPGVHGGEYTRRIEKNKADLRKGLGKAVDAYENPAVDPEDAPVNPTDPTVGDGVPDAPGGDVDASPKRKAYKQTALGGMTDVGGASFEQIASELGFSVAGAKQAVDKALEKARFLATGMDDDDREILVLTAMNDYVKYLTKSGELTAADIQLMKDHPDIVRDLDGFREFLHNHIRRARKADQKLIDPVRDDGDDVVVPVGESKVPVLYLRSRKK